MRYLGGAETLPQVWRILGPKVYTRAGAGSLWRLLGDASVSFPASRGLGSWLLPLPSMPATGVLFSLRNVLEGPLVVGGAISSPDLWKTLVEGWEECEL